MVAVLSVLTAVELTGCGVPGEAAPRCRADQRLGVVAQSVPDAAYVPCVTELATGWSLSSYHVEEGGARFSLRSDRADEPVRVELTPSCSVGRATPVEPRDEGVRTYQRVDSISPRYAGRLLDVFPGGCVTYEFVFERGPHIALLDELGNMVALYSRRQLRQELRDDLGVDLQP